MKDLMNNCSELATNSKELFSRGMNADEVINHLDADGLARKMIKSAWIDWKMSDNLLISKINGKAVSAHIQKGERRYEAV